MESVRIYLVHNSPGGEVRMQELRSSCARNPELEKLHLLRVGQNAKLLQLQNMCQEFCHFMFSFPGSFNCIFFLTSSEFLKVTSVLTNESDFALVI